MVARIPIALFLIIALLVNGVWHVAHADFHQPANAAVEYVPPSKHVGNLDHGGDTLVHPVHQQAYLYRVELASPSAWFSTITDNYLLRFSSDHLDLRFRPPAA